ncbi:MAG: beta-ketoacyl synthase N-terminal-like domain-containing protein [Blautia sp.]|jgi:3-oxoacyl-(acyl-carrier-protein) synthase
MGYENNVRITGLGLVNRAGLTPEKFWEALKDPELAQSLPRGAEAPVKLKLPGSRLRRMNRYCRLALYCAIEASEDAAVPQETDPFLRGTIFTTGYGSAAANLKFFREAQKGEPDFCSPTVFTGIVPNSCVGTVCMFLNCKGVSTVLAGGNHLEYSSLLLRKGKAKYILAGAVEEYTPELFASLRQNPCARNVEIEEGTVVLCLEQAAALEEKGRPLGYCSLKHTVSVSLGSFPLVSEAWKEDGKAQIEEALARCLREAFGSTQEAARVDAVFSAAAGTDFDLVEKTVLERFFPRERVIGKLKKVTGETVGCGLSISVAAGALCLSHGYVPGVLTAAGKDLSVQRLLVTGYDAAGNYSCCILER